jgi:predicted DNA-binding ribbon-helix-helix protein
VAGDDKEDFANDVKAQEEQLKVMNKIEEIDEEMRYKRNVSVYLNVQCNSFFTLTN